jgi:hypothetical protein
MLQAVMNAEEEHCSMALCCYLFDWQAADCMAAAAFETSNQALFTKLRIFGVVRRWFSEPRTRLAKFIEQ